jgi:hypothetical protein
VKEGRGTGMLDEVWECVEDVEVKVWGIVMSMLYTTACCLYSVFDQYDGGRKL